MEQYPYLFDEKYRNKFFTQSNFYGGGTRAVHPYGQVSLIPMHLHACYTRYNEVWKPNVIATSATPMDKHGYFNLSLGGWEKKFLDTADVVILEIVDDMPNKMCIRDRRTVTKRVWRKLWKEVCLLAALAARALWSSAS